MKDETTARMNATDNTVSCLNQWMIFRNGAPPFKSVSYFAHRILLYPCWSSAAMLEMTKNYSSVRRSLLLDLVQLILYNIMKERGEAS